MATTSSELSASDISASHHCGLLALNTNIYQHSSLWNTGKGTSAWAAMAALNDQISDRLAQLHQVPLNDIPIDALECPICIYPYSHGPGGVQEAVRVIPEPPHRGCQHLFCRGCIEALFRSRHLWSTRCPMCRAQWFDPLVMDRTTAVDWQQLQMFMERVGAGNGWHGAPGHQAHPIAGREEGRTPIVELPPSVPDAPEAVEEPREVSGGIFSEHDVQVFSEAGRMHRAAAFLEYLLAMYDIEDEGDGHISNSVQLLESAIERLWQELDEVRYAHDRVPRRAWGHR